MAINGVSVNNTNEEHINYDAVENRIASAVYNKATNVLTFHDEEGTQKFNVEIEQDTLELDTTLAKTGYAADAKAVGDEIDRVENAIPNIDSTLSVNGDAADAGATGALIVNAMNQVAEGFNDAMDEYLVENAYGQMYVDENNGLHVSPVTPSAETVITGAVEDWLDDHPEATTTVEDGSITVSKFASSVVDDTLSLEGHPADAKAVGKIGRYNTINYFNKRITENGVTFLQEANGTIHVSGEATSTTTLTLYSGDIPSWFAVGNVLQILFSPISTRLKLRLVKLIDGVASTIVQFSEDSSYVVPNDIDLSDVTGFEVRLVAQTGESLNEEVYPKILVLPSDGTADVTNRLTLCLRDGHTTKPIDAETVSAMLDVLETYCEKAYTASGTDAELIYESGKGLYTDDLGSGADEGQYSIICNALVGAVINAIPWNLSRYSGNETNARLPWGYQWDSTAIIRRINRYNPTDIELRERYLNSNLLALYAKEHGFWYENNDVYQPCAGDIFFSGTSGDQYWRGIDHCGIVLCASDNFDGDGYLWVAEAYPTTKRDTDGTERACGIRFHRRPKSDIDSYARMPMGGAKGTSPKLLQAVENVTVDGSVSRVIYAADSTFMQTLQKGFYTILLELDGISAQNSASDEIRLYLRSRGYDSSTAYPLCKCGKYRYLTFYNPLLTSPVNVFQIHVNSADVTCEVKSIKIYKGFVPPYGKALTEE